MDKSVYSALADLVLVVHTGFVLFVVVGLAVIIVGAFADWSWVRNLRLRLAHLAAIVVVVAQAWLGILCPLTSLEIWLREQAGQTAWRGSFIQHWLQRLLYYDAPDWVFIVLYTGFGLLVLAVWVFVPPRRFQVSGGEGS